MGVAYYQAGQATPTLQKKSPLTLNEEDLRSPVIFWHFRPKFGLISNKNTRNLSICRFFINQTPRVSHSARGLKKSVKSLLFTPYTTATTLRKWGFFSPKMSAFSVCHYLSSCCVKSMVKSGRGKPNRLSHALCCVKHETINTIRCMYAKTCFDLLVCFKSHFLRIHQAKKQRSRIFQKRSPSVKKKLFLRPRVHKLFAVKNCLMKLHNSTPAYKFQCSL